MSTKNKINLPDVGLYSPTNIEAFIISFQQVYEADFKYKNILRI